ncbi:hypothetical protein FS842_009851 [Serendipita sp. 407]|nr:hypothetical protein FS842_009851 [Serendipita sp. 407]
MSFVADVSQNMGEYLLKGWTLTNESCPTCSVPKMRSPQYSGDAKTLICVNCDHLDSKSSSLPRADLAQPRIPAPNAMEEDAEKLSISSSDMISVKSTPPTDVSQLPSPPFVLPPPSAETLRRRAQSDKASQEIGNLMLRGYTMLADECTNSTCYGVPLVRAPGETSKECVICKRKYNPQGDIISMSPANKLPQSNVSTIQVTAKRPLKKGNLQEVKPQLSTALPRATEEANRFFQLPDNSLHTSLHTALGVLERQLVEASTNNNASRIGEIAESISKVSKAIRDISLIS